MAIVISYLQAKDECNYSKYTETAEKIDDGRYEAIVGLFTIMIMIWDLSDHCSRLSNNYLHMM